MDILKETYEQLIQDLEKNYQEKYEFLIKKFKIMERQMKDYINKIQTLQKDAVKKTNQEEKYKYEAISVRKQYNELYEKMLDVQKKGSKKDSKTKPKQILHNYIENIFETQRSPKFLINTGFPQFFINYSSNLVKEIYHKTILNYSDLFLDCLEFKNSQKKFSKTCSNLQSHVDYVMFEQVQIKKHDYLENELQKLSKIQIQNPDDQQSFINNLSLYKEVIKDYNPGKEKSLNKQIKEVQKYCLRLNLNLIISLLSKEINKTNQSVEDIKFLLNETHDNQQVQFFIDTKKNSFKKKYSKLISLVLQ